MSTLMTRYWTVALAAMFAAVGSVHADAPPGNAGAFEPVAEVIRQMIDDGHIAGGSALIYHDGEVVYQDAFGHADLEADQPLETDSLIRIASMTKPITSIAILMLHEQGRLDINDPLSDYIPAFENARVLTTQDFDPNADQLPTALASNGPTIKHLLTHTSGITYGFLGTPLSRLYREHDIPDGLRPLDHPIAETADRLGAMPLLFEPGTAYAYGLNTDVLGRVVEVAAEQPLDVFLTEHIFEPLGMHDTFFCVPGQRQDELATVYTPDGAGDEGLRPIGDEVVTIANVRFGPHYATAEPCMHFSGGAGLVSTLDDYRRFLQMLLQDGQLGDARLLQPGTVEQITQNQLPDGVEAAPFGYGFGILTDGDAQPAAAGTYFWGGLFGTYFWNDPQNDVAAIFMTQIFPLNADGFHQNFQQAVYDALDAR